MDILAQMATHRLIQLFLIPLFFKDRNEAKYTRWCLVHKRFLFSVTWETLNVGMEDGHWPWRLPARRLIPCLLCKTLDIIEMNLGK